jgi:hypothetical protein
MWPHGNAPANIEGNGEIRQRDLVKNALRMRPDRVILGECRGEEAFDMLQAMNTGHEGSMATIHANTPRDAISRLEQMLGMTGMPMTVGLDPQPDSSAIRSSCSSRACPTASARSRPSPNHRHGRRHHPDAGDLPLRAHRHGIPDGAVEGHFERHRRAAALPGGPDRHGHQPAISMVAREMPDPIGSEFGMVADEVTFGSDLVTALANMQSRVGHPDLPLLVSSVSIQSATGGNLREILDGLSKVVRARLKMKAKIRAISAEGRISAVFLSAMPVILFIVLLTLMPDYYSGVWEYSETWWGFSGLIFWLVAGNAMIMKMVSFKV